VRVARIIERLPPARGGQEIHGAELSRALAGLGVEQHVYSRTGLAPAGVDHSVSPMLRAPVSRRALSAFCAWAGARVSKDHRNDPFDLIHVHGDFVQATLGALLARQLGVPCVLTVHGGFRPNPRQELGRLGSFSAMSAIWAVSPNIADDIRGLGVSVPIKVSPSGVREEFFSVTRRAAAPPTVMTVGRLDPVKGIEAVLQAYDSLSDRPEVRWMVFAGGSGRYADQIRKEISQRPSMELREEHRPERMAAALASAAVFVQPSVDLGSRHEGVPTSMLEAIAAGTPVVASRVGGIPSVLADGDGGLLIEAGDGLELARGIELTLDDPIAAEERARRATELGAARRWADVAREALDFYRQALSGLESRPAILALPWLTYGGAERFVVELANDLSQRKHQIAVAAAPGELSGQLSSAEFVSLRPGRSPIDVLRNTLTLTGTFIRLRPSAVNGHALVTALTARVAGLLARTKARHAMTIHVPERRGYSPVVGALGSVAFDRVLPVADGVRSELVRYALPGRRDRFRVVRAGIETRDSSRQPGPVVGIVARLVERKGHRVALQAWRHLLDSGEANGWTLELWGDGPLRQTIEAEAKLLQLGGTAIVRGNVPQARDEIARLSIVVQPSLREGLPLSLLEAMAAGVPVVASDLPGCRELIGDAGALVPPGDSEALANSVGRLIADEGERDALGAAGQLRVRTTFSRAAMIDAYERELWGD
jgi:glycosyltransferase involved in cell wall biosynthesis